MVEFKVHRTIGENRMEAFDPHSIVSIKPHNAAMVGEFKYITELHIRRRLLWNRKVLVLETFGETCRKVSIAKVDVTEQVQEIVNNARDIYTRTVSQAGLAAEARKITEEARDVVVAAKSIAMDQLDQAKHQVVLAREIADEAQHAKREALEHRNDAKGFQEMACTAATSASVSEKTCSAAVERTGQDREATERACDEAAKHATNAAGFAGAMRDDAIRIENIVEEVTK